MPEIPNPRRVNPDFAADAATRAFTSLRDSGINLTPDEHNHLADVISSMVPMPESRFWWKHGSGAHSDRAYVYDHNLDDDNGESGYVVAFMGPSKALNAYRAQRYTDHLNREAS